MKKVEQKEKEVIKRQITDCLEYMQALTSGFNEVTDSELVSYYIYEKGRRKRGTGI